MESCGQRLALAHQHRVFGFALGCDHFHALPDAFNFGSADEDHFKGLVKESSFPDRAVNLPSIGIAAHSDVERAQASLLWILYIACQQDASRAGAEGRLHPHEILKLRESVFPEQLEEGSG